MRVRVLDFGGFELVGCLARGGHLWEDIEQTLRDCAKYPEDGYYDAFRPTIIGIKRVDRGCNYGAPGEYHVDTRHKLGTAGYRVLVAE